MEQIHPGTQRTPQEIRLGKTDIIILCALRNTDVKSQLLTSSLEVVFRNAGTNQSPVNRRIPDADIKISG